MGFFDTVLKVGGAIKDHAEKTHERNEHTKERTINWAEKLRAKSDDELKRIVKEGDDFFHDPDKTRAARFILQKRGK